MKKKILIALALILAILTVAGCADKQNAETPVETTTEIPDFVLQTAPPVQSIQGKPEESEPFKAEPRLDPSLADIAPMPITFDAEKPDNTTLRVSFDIGSLYGTSINDAKIKVKVHVYDTYDSATLSKLRVGDTIIVYNQVVTVENIRKTENGICINESETSDGYFFVPDENGTYYVDTASIFKDYYAVSELTLPISPDFIYTDYYKSAENPVVLTLEQFFTENPEIDFDFNPDNTSIVVENGQVVSLTRIQLP